MEGITLINGRPSNPMAHTTSMHERGFWRGLLGAIPVIASIAELEVEEGDSESGFSSMIWSPVRSDGSGTGEWRLQARGRR